MPKTEQGGLAHLVHGWIQQRQPVKVCTRWNICILCSLSSQGLFISGDIASTSTSLAATGSHYFLTEHIAHTVANAFKRSSPSGIKCIQKPSKQVYGSSTIQDYSLLVLSCTSSKAGFIGTSMTSVPLCCFL